MIIWYGGFLRVVVFDGFGAESFFCDEFCRGTEEIMEAPPFFGVEIVEKQYSVGIIQAVVSDSLPDVRPVFLFDMGVVIFVGGPASYELGGMFSFGKAS